MSKIKTAIFDVDSVLFDYRFEWYNFCREFHSFSGSFDDFCSNLPIDIMNEFNTHPNFAHMKAVDGTNDVLNKLYNDDIDLYILSSCCSDNPDEAVITSSNRIYNLYDNFGDVFKDIVLLKIGDDKSSFLNKFDSSSTIFVDDYLKNFRGSNCVNVLAEYCNFKHYSNDDIDKSGFKIDYQISNILELLDIVDVNNNFDMLRSDYDSDFYQRFIYDNNQKVKD